MSKRKADVLPSHAPLLLGSWLAKNFKRTQVIWCSFKSFSITVSILACWEKSSSKTNILIFLLSFFQPFLANVSIATSGTLNSISTFFSKKRGVFDWISMDFSRSRLTRQFRWHLVKVSPYCFSRLLKFWNRSKLAFSVTICTVWALFGCVWI